MNLKVNAVYTTVDGEVNSQGIGCPTIMIRLQGCPLQCSYCDTPQAQSFNKGSLIPVNTLVNVVKQYVREQGFYKVTITGGEPLLQMIPLLSLVENLSPGEDMVSVISIETSGLLCWPKNWPVNIITDYKLLSSGYQGKDFPGFSCFENLNLGDFVKFVITDESDFREAVIIQTKLQEEGCLAKFAYSPVHDKLTPKELYTWIERLVRQGDIKPPYFNMQMHKYLGVQ